MNRDLHRETALNNRVFDVLMCSRYGTEWRWEMPASEQRMHAKRWNYGALYGIPAADLRLAIDRDLR